LSLESQQVTVVLPTQYNYIVESQQVTVVLPTQYNYVVESRQVTVVTEFLKNVLDTAEDIYITFTIQNILDFTYIHKSINIYLKQKK